jgi:sporulation protein YlmC with PRC-barrel domain
MKSRMIFLTAMTLIAFSYMSTSVIAGEMKDPVGKAHEEISLRIGKDVKNMLGENLGTVRDFISDSEGRISFAIVSHGGFMGMGEKRVAIPYSALTYNEEKQYFTCAASEDQLANAPEFENEEQLRDRSFAEEVYRHFGQRPYWSEEPKGTEEPKGMEKSN